MCGAPLLAPSVVLEQERKVVSVLFCDVVGFTAMSEPAEPLLRAVDVDPHRLYGSMKLGAPDLLISRKRASIILQRDRYLGELG